VPHADIGEVMPDARLTIAGGGQVRVEAEISRLKAAWQAPLDW
jgi:hypothetical protein